MVVSLTSASLRLAGVGGKFVAIVALAAEGGSREVGRFILFFGAVNLLVFVIGLDFHQFVFREIIARRSSPGQFRIVCGHQLFNLGVYLATAASIFAVFALAPHASVLRDLPLAWLATILITDHAAQELSRIFTVLSRPMPANIIYAAKTGAWAWVGAATMFVNDQPLRAESFYPIWLGANVAAIVYGGSVLLRMYRGSPVSVPPRFGSWILRGLRVSSLFYVTSVSTSALGTLDRFILVESGSVSDAGLYGFWQSICSLIPVLVYAMAGMHFLPRLLRAYPRQPAEFAALKREFLRKSTVISVAGAAGVAVFAPLAPALLGRADLSPSIPIVGLLCLAGIATALWQAPYQALYSSRQDVFLAVALVSVAVANVALNFWVAPLYGVSGVAAAAALSNGLLLGVLSIRANMLSRRYDDRREGRLAAD